MDKNFSMDELNYFTGSDEIFQHSLSKKMCYTEGVSYLAKNAGCHWLIDEIALIILPRLVKKNKDWFYSIEFSVSSDCSALIVVGDGNGNVHLEHRINYTDFLITEKPVKFYLCDSGSYYCLMLPSEY